MIFFLSILFFLYYIIILDCWLENIHSLGYHYLFEILLNNETLWTNTIPNRNDYIRLKRNILKSI